MPRVIRLKFVKILVYSTELNAGPKFWKILKLFGIFREMIPKARPWFNDTMTQWPIKFNCRRRSQGTSSYPFVISNTKQGKTEPAYWVDLQFLPLNHYYTTSSSIFCFNDMPFYLKKFSQAFEKLYFYVHHESKLHSGHFKYDEIIYLRIREQKGSRQKKSKVLWKIIASWHTTFAIFLFPPTYI